MKLPFRRPPALLTAVLACATLVACGGDNLFRTEPGTGTQTGPADTAAPTVTIAFPRDSITVAIADSVFVQARVTDNRRIASVTFEAYSLRGDPALGTQTRIDRFTTKTVEFDAAGRAVTDTTLTRYLLAGLDSLPERDIRVVVTAKDSAGNTRADTATIAIGGPRVQVVTPAAGTQYGAGTPLSVRLNAEDRFDLITAVRLRATGAFAVDTTISLSVPVASVDTVVVLSIPLTSTGALTLEATATSGGRIVGTSRPVTVQINPPAQDAVAPRVSFSFTMPDRVETRDTLTVAVQATDDVAVDSVGATVLAIRRTAAGADTLARMMVGARAAAATLRFPVAALGLTGLDTLTVGFEVTAWALDARPNCATATTPNTLQSLGCVISRGVRLSEGSGRLANSLIARGTTVALGDSTDRIADLLSDGVRVFASNFSQNRVEVLPLTGTALGTPISVGSQPWGLALGINRDTVFVANSGGTNISAIALGSGPLVESRRIRTPDAQLFAVSYDQLSDTASAVQLRDYSDRPQFLGQVRTGQILYSTKPTATREDGTIRIYDPTKDTSYVLNRGPEIFTRYATDQKNRGIIVNALSSTLASRGEIRVCPRRVTFGGPDPACFTGRPSQVAAYLASLRAAGETDTRFDEGVSIESVGLSDTTFVAVSRDFSTIAFGEGARDPGRVMLFKALSTGQLVGSSVETTDLIGNAAERVIGLALNGDGSLGVARGSLVYFFESNLRQQGVVASGAPAGGSALHPLNVNYPNGTALRLGFASGVTAEGVPYIDVIDSYSFRSLRRIFMRDQVTGALIAVPVLAGDPEAGTLALRIFAVTPRGIVRLGITPADLAQ